MFFRSGWQSALTEQESALALLTKDDVDYSQEFLYGTVAAAYYALCGFEGEIAYAHLQNAEKVLPSTGDSWIQLQFEYVDQWVTELLTGFEDIQENKSGLLAKKPKPSPFEDIGNRFSEIDDYSATFSYHSAAQFQGREVSSSCEFLRCYCHDPEKLGGLEAFIASDPFVLIGLDLTSNPGKKPCLVSAAMDRRWFAEGWRDLSAKHIRNIRPLMSGIQIFRILPLSFSIDELGHIQSQSPSR